MELHRIADKIEQNLFDLQPIGQNRRKVVREFDIECNVAPLEVVAGHIDRLVHDKPEAGGRRVATAKAYECLKPPHDVCGAADLCGRFRSCLNGGRVSQGFSLQ